MVTKDRFSVKDFPLDVTREAGKVLIFRLKINIESQKKKQIIAIFKIYLQ